MDNNQTRKAFPWATAIIAAAVVILAALALVAYLKTARGVKDTLDKVIGTAPEIARNFMTGNITTTFRESIPQISSTQGDVLELAVFRCDETFKRTDEKWAGWGWVYLGTTVAEIRVPVSFRYHLRLSDPWRLVARDQVCRGAGAGDPPQPAAGDSHQRHGATRGERLGALRQERPA